MNSIGIVKKIMYVFIVLALIGVGFFYFSNKDFSIINQNNLVVIPQDNWQTYTDEIQKVSFNYPEKLLSENIFLVDWPPNIVVMNVPFVCVPSESIDTGVTTSQRISDKEYCVRHSSLETALSSFTYHSYAFEKDGKSVNLMFSIRENKCSGLEVKEDQKLCEQEKSSFSLESLVDQIATSIVFH